MTLVVRGELTSIRRPTVFTFSAAIHAAALLWVVIGARRAGIQMPQSLYDMTIKPHEREVVWYNLHTLLPAIHSAQAEPAKRPPRAARKATQSIVSAKRDDPTPAPKIWLPDTPKAAPPKPMQLPNLVAIAAPPPAMPEAPKVEAAPKAPAKLPMDVATPRAAVRKFTPPVTKRPQAKLAEAMPEAPSAAALTQPGAASALPFDAAVPRVLRKFTAPPTQPPTRAATGAAPTAPEVQVVTMPSATATMAIVGLDPAKSITIPEPPAPHDAGFSAGPKPNPNGSNSVSSSEAGIMIPDLSAAGSSKEARPTMETGLPAAARQNLASAMRMAAGMVPGGATSYHPAAPRVSSSPDPRMDGRAVYTMAIQMPNITSHSGSWLVWFAEHDPIPGAPPVKIAAPNPLHIVDPKYVVDAMNERVEGMVRLSAVIRKDGSVDSIELLKHLDSRLDGTAEEALAKWRFTPASRDGKPVDVDAVFEVPFRLAPKGER